MTDNKNVTQMKNATTMNRKKFIGNLALISAALFAFRNVFSLFGGKKQTDRKKKVTIKENPDSIKRNSTVV